MARTAAKLPAGNRITDFISLGVIAKTFPIAKIRDVLAATGKASVRERDLPAHVMIYYVIVMALFMNASCREVLRCLLEGIRCLSQLAQVHKRQPKGVEPGGAIGPNSQGSLAANGCSLRLARCTVGLGQVQVEVGIGAQADRPTDQVHRILNRAAAKT